MDTNNNNIYFIFNVNIRALLDTGMFGATFDEFV